MTDLLQEAGEPRTYAMDLKKFFAELKRRHVYRVAVAYAVGRLADYSGCDFDLPGSPNSRPGR